MFRRRVVERLSGPQLSRTFQIRTNEPGKLAYGEQSEQGPEVADQFDGVERVRKKVVREIDCGKYGLRSDERD